MRIAVVEQELQNRTATGERGRAIERFLRGLGHTVDVIAPPPALIAGFARHRFSLTSRLRRRLLRLRSLPHLWDYLADALEPKLRAGRYDFVIARSHPVAYVLTRQLGTRAIFDVANVAFLEAYHSWGVDLSELDILHKKEMEIYEAVDHILSPHDIWTNFFRRHVYDSDKVITVRLGCYPVTSRAEYRSPARLVYAGSYEYIQDPYLLSLLSRCSPFEIDCFGSRDPNYAFLPAQLRYRGYAANVDFLSEYQLGLITVSADRLRRHSPATKFPYYFAYGLPVLFPEWMEEGHTYSAAVPYSETTFVDVVREVVTNRDRWQALSESAVATAHSLTWDRVLVPLARLLA